MISIMANFCKKNLIFSTLLASSLSFAEGITEICLNPLIANDPKMSATCLETTKKGTFNPAAVEVCSKILSNTRRPAAAIDCLIYIKGGYYDPNATEICSTARSKENECLSSIKNIHFDSKLMSICSKVLKGYYTASDAPECLSIIKTGTFNSEAISFCSKISSKYETKTVKCLKDIQNAYYDPNVTKLCTDIEAFNDQCMSQAKDAHFDLKALPLCSKVSVSDLPVCLQAMKEGYFDQQAIELCLNKVNQRYHFFSETLKCISVIKNKDYKGSLETCIKTPPKDDRGWMNCLENSPSTYRALNSIEPDPKNPKPNKMVPDLHDRVSASIKFLEEGQKERALTILKSILADTY